MKGTKKAKIVDLPTFAAVARYRFPQGDVVIYPSKSEEKITLGAVLWLLEQAKVRLMNGED